MYASTVVTIPDPYLFYPDCSRILFNVPGAKPSPRDPPAPGFQI
jgi:hypothetical protein